MTTALPDGVAADSAAEDELEAADELAAALEDDALDALLDELEALDEVDGSEADELEAPRASPHPAASAPLKATKPVTPDSLTNSRREIIYAPFDSLQDIV